MDDSADHESGTEAAAEALRTVLTGRAIEPGLRAPLDELSDVASMHVPVRDGSARVVLSFDLLGFTGDEPADRLLMCRDRLLVGASTASALISQR